MRHVLRRLIDLIHVLRHEVRTHVEAINPVLVEGSGGHARPVALVFALVVGITLALVFAPVVGITQELGITFFAPTVGITFALAQSWLSRLMRLLVSWLMSWLMRWSSRWLSRWMLSRWMLSWLSRWMLSRLMRCGRHRRWRMKVM